MHSIEGDYSETTVKSSRGCGGSPPPFKLVHAKGKAKACCYSLPEGCHLPMTLLAKEGRALCPLAVSHGRFVSLLLLRPVVAVRFLGCETHVLLTKLEERCNPRSGVIASVLALFTGLGLSWSKTGGDSASLFCWES